MMSISALRSSESATARRTSGLSKGGESRLISSCVATLDGAMVHCACGAWALSPEDLADVPGYGPSVEANREEARRIMQGLGYGPDRPLRIKVSTREIPSYRDPAVIVIDHLKSIFIEATLDIQDTSIWYTTMGRKAFSLAVNQSGLGLDDPDTVFYEGFAC